MNILLVNDDGILSPGLEILARALTPHGKVYVAAPATEQSAKSHGITINSTIKIEESPLIPGSLKTIKVHGSPADATRVGLSIFNVEFDLVVSGVNNGPNIAKDILYSGTVAAAKEARLSGIPAIAVSACNLDLDYLYDEVIKTLDEVIENKYYLVDGVLNINFPSFMYAKPLGIKFTTQGNRYYHSEFIEKTNEKDVFYIKGSLNKFNETEDSDVLAYESGYISITPLLIDQTDRKSLNKLTNK